MNPNQPPPGMWTTHHVAGHACRVYEPAAPSPHGFTVVYLHAAGLEDISDHPAFVAEFARHGLRIVAPQTGPSWWSDRICPAFDEHITAERYVLEAVMPYLAEQWNVTPPRIALLGISMGGQGALRLAYKYPDRFPVAAAISAAIDFHRWLEPRPPAQPEITEQLRPLYRDPEDARQDTATLHIHPLNWPRHQLFCTDPADHWWDGGERLRMKLYSLGVPHDCDLETAAGGHSWDYFSAMAPRAMEFIAERLERERLRVV